MGRIVTFEELACEDIKEPTHKAARIEQLIKIAEQAVESLTGRLFYKRDAMTLYADGCGKELLRLEHPPIAVTSVTVDDVLLGSTEYEIETDPVGEKALFTPKLRGLNGYVWPRGTRNIKIVGSFGHVYPRGTDPETYEAPQMVKRAIMRMVVHNLASLSTQVSSTGRGEIIRERLGSAEFQYAQGTSASSGWLGDTEIQQMLARYKRLKLASV